MMTDKTRNWLARNVFSPLFMSTEKSSLSIAYIVSHDIPAGSFVGPDKLLGGWGYPKLNHIYRKVKTGAGELIAFTQKELGKIDYICNQLNA